MSRRIHVLALPLIFPAGLAAGESGSDNRLTIARDGLGRPLLRGTSLAGRLRQVWRRRMLRMHDASAVDAAVTRFFGSAAGDDEDAEARETIGSPLRVGDVSLNISLDAKNSSTVVERTHHLRDRHTGVVADGGLFSLEACPPGTTGLATLWLHDDDDSPDESAGFSGDDRRVVRGWRDLGRQVGSRDWFGEVERAGGSSRLRPAAGGVACSVSGRSPDLALETRSICDSRVVASRDSKCAARNRRGGPSEQSCFGSTMRDADAGHSSGTRSVGRGRSGAAVRRRAAASGRCDGATVVAAPWFVAARALSRLVQSAGRVRRRGSKHSRRNTASGRQCRAADARRAWFGPHGRYAEWR
jgi:hypothetical protein